MCASEMPEARVGEQTPRKGGFPSQERSLRRLNLLRDEVEIGVAAEYAFREGAISEQLLSIGDERVRPREIGFGGGQVAPGNEGTLGIIHTESACLVGLQGKLEDTVCQSSSFRCAAATHSVGD